MFKNTYFYFHCACRIQMYEAMNHIRDKDCCISVEAGKVKSRSIHKDVNYSIGKRYHDDRNAKQTVRHMSKRKDIDDYIAGCDVLICHKPDTQYLGEEELFDQSKGNHLHLQEQVEKDSLFNVFNV